MQFLNPSNYTLPSQSGSLNKDDFTPKQNIGKGSFGKVYRVIHKITNDEFAIKVLAKKQIVNLKMKDQIRNEINILELVEHENIISMKTYFEDNENIYLVMELGGVNLTINQLASPLLCAQEAKSLRRKTGRKSKCYLSNCSTSTMSLRPLPTCTP